MSDCRFGVSPVNYSDPGPETKCLHGVKYVYNCEYGYFSSCTKRLNISG